MKKQFNKIVIPETLKEIFPIKVKFPDHKMVYDFGKYFDTDISRTFAKVFYEKCSKMVILSREGMFGTVNKFFTYLESVNVLTWQQFDRKLLTGFAIWIDNQELNISTKYSIYQKIEMYFKEIKKIKVLPFKNLNIPANPFTNSNENRKPPKTLTNEQIKIILSICYKKIDEIVNEFRLTQKKFKDLELSQEDFKRKDVYHVAYYFYKKYGYLPLLTELSVVEKNHIKKIGGVDEINSRLSPNANTLFPFYLVLLVELAANSDALRQIKIDCIKEDPLFEDRCFIIWDKARASSEQKRNVFKKKKYGAYQIIEMLKELTQHTRKYVKKEFENNLFIIRGENEKNKLSEVIPKRFNDEAQKFIKENNIDFIFNPSDIRPTILTEIYRVRKDVVSVSKIANHKNINTTLLYIVNEETKKENRQYLSEKQSKIIDNIINKENYKIEDSENFGAENIGFSCNKPIKNNKACINWMAELTNPELIIPENSEYLSKIIALKNAIINTKMIMNKERFSLLYEPTLELIENDILNRFSKSIIEESEILAKNLEMPLLGDY